MKTTEFVIGREWEVLAYYGHHRTDLKHIDCPICEGKKKFRLNEYEGKPMYICVCGSGDLFKLLVETTGKDFKTLAREIDETFGNTYEQKEAPKVNDRLSNTVNRFRAISKIQGTPAEIYLNSRGITQLPTGGVKYSEREHHTDAGRNFGAMYAIASNEYSEAIQRHLTYLDGNKKADIERNKKMLSLQEYSG